MKTVIMIGLLLLTTLAVGQDVKPAPPSIAVTDPAPAEIKLTDLPRLDQLEIQNLYLALNALQSEMRRLQSEANAISNEKLPALIATMKTRKEFDGYEFDFNTVSFKLKK